LLLPPKSVFGDQTVDQLVDEALANNPELAAMKANWQQMSHKAPQAASFKDPIVSFTFSNYPYDSLSSSEYPMTGNELKIAQPLPYPGKLENQAALADEQAQWFEAQYLDKHYQVARRVKDAWYRLYFNQKAVEVIERNLNLVDDVIRLAEVRYETGQALQQDVLKAQLQKSRMMEQLITFEQQRPSLEAELTRLLGRTAKSSYTVPHELELIQVEQSLQDLEDAGLANRPLNNAFQSMMDRYRIQKKLAELDSYPDFTIYGSWRFRDDDLRDGGTDFVSAGVSVTLPIFREKRRAATAEAVTGMSMVEQHKIEFHNAIAESVQKAYARMHETGQQTSLYRDGIIPQTVQAFQSALSAYQVGKLEFISLMDALITTFKAELEYFRVTSEYMRSVAWLEAESTIPLIGPRTDLAHGRTEANLNSMN
jgi:outer membrane protein TolC